MSILLRFEVQMSLNFQTFQKTRNAFQWGAYCPLVARISQHALLWGGGVPAQGMYLPRGVPAQGVYLPRECTCLGGVPTLGGVPAWRLYLPGGYLPRRVYLRHLIADLGGGSGTRAA